MLQDLFNTKDKLLQTVKEHPYFSVAQFFLLKQTDPSSKEYDQQIAKTSILFNNPFWLNFQLQKVNAGQIIEEPAFSFTEEITSNEATITNSIIEKPAPAVEHIAETLETGIDENINEEEILTDEQTPAEPEISPLKIDLKLSAADTKEDTINFEPLHTSDYFASQGIKLSEEVKPEDKLGKQLKSFTDWLKTMKKVHTEQPLENSNYTDSSIQNLAERSNTEDTILTEAMAEVLLKQGKIGKAVEVYQKLSLLNPSKSAYFAAKIKQFKV